MSFDVSATLDAVREAVDDRVKELHERIREEQDEAMEAARTYARHLADGGSPLVYPKQSGGGGFWSSRLVSMNAALQATYAVWNAERGSTNKVSPIQNHAPWKIAEHLHGNIGEPCSLETLRKVSGSLGAVEVRRAVEAAMTDSILAEKGKLDGKVAYRLRPRRAGEQSAEGHRERIREDAFMLESVKA